jgi:hypothetical protein
MVTIIEIYNVKPAGARFEAAQRRLAAAVRALGATEGAVHTHEAELDHLARKLAWSGPGLVLSW